DPNALPLPGQVLDKDLVRLNLLFDPTLLPPGLFLLSVNNPGGATGTGQIRLWNDFHKDQQILPGYYTAATLPTSLFVEGTEPSAAMRESSISITFLSIDALKGLVPGVSTQLAVSVTPVILTGTTPLFPITYPGTNLPFFIPFPRSFDLFTVSTGPVGNQMLF